MEFVLARNWWLLALRGVLALVFGLVACFWPQILWLAVVYTFAAFVLLDGIFALVAAVTDRRALRHWWALLLEGVVEIAFGVVTFVWPLAAVLEMWLLVGFIAAWLILTGVLEVVGAIQLRRYISGAWALILSGVLSILLGIGFALVPPVALWVLAVWIGAFSIVSGVLMLVLAFRLRALLRHAPTREGLTVPDGRMPAVFR